MTRQQSRPHNLVTDIGGGTSQTVDLNPASSAHTTLEQPSGTAAIAGAIPNHEDTVATEAHFATDRSNDPPLTMADLPPRETKRWVSRRKAVVVMAIRQGLLSFEDACGRYAISDEELRSWQRLIADHGVAGLRVTRVQEYRRP